MFGPLGAIVLDYSRKLLRLVDDTLRRFSGTEIGFITSRVSTSLRKGWHSYFWLCAARKLNPLGLATAHQMNAGKNALRHQDRSSWSFSATSRRLQGLCGNSDSAGPAKRVIPNLAALFSGWCEGSVFSCSDGRLSSRGQGSNGQAQSM